MTAARRGPPPRATDSLVRLLSNGRIACWKTAAEPSMPRILEKGNPRLESGPERKATGRTDVRRPGCRKGVGVRCAPGPRGERLDWNDRLRARARRVRTVFSDFLITCMSWRKL